MIACALVMGSITVIEAADPDPPPPGTSYPLYGSTGFALLLLVFFIHLLVSTFKSRIRKRPVLFFIHIGIVLLLIGSFLTWRFSVRGTLYLDEGEADNSITVRDRYWITISSPADSAVRYGIPHSDLQKTGYSVETDTPAGTLEMTRFFPHVHVDHIAQESNVETGTHAIMLHLETPHGSRPILLAENWIDHEDIAGLGLYFGIPERSESELTIVLAETQDTVFIPLDIHGGALKIEEKDFNIKFLEYHPDYKVGFPPDPTKSPVNPAVRIALSWRGSPAETLLVFQRFPGFTRPRHPAFGAVSFELSSQERFVLSMYPHDDAWEYRFSRPGHVATGSIQEGDTILTVTGSHGELPLVVDELINNAEIVPVVHPAERGPAAVALRFVESPDSFWLVENGPEVVVSGAGTKIYTLNLTSRIELPFAVELIRAIREDYPNSGIPRSYRSLVSIVTGEKDGDSLQWIETNSPLQLNGWRLYQAEYGTENGTTWSGFQVSYDPGALLVAGGCVVLFIGLILLLIRPRSPWSIVVFILVLSEATWAQEPPDIPASDGVLIRESGRVKPLSTLARDLEITYSLRFPGKARDGLLAILHNPTEWLRFVNVHVDRDLATTLGLSPGTWKSAPVIMDNASELQRIAMEDRGSPEADHAAALLERLEVLSRIEEIVAFVPGSSRDEPWYGPTHEDCPDWAVTVWESITDCYVAGDFDGVGEGYHRLSEEQRTRHGELLPSRLRITIERYWNRIRPIRLLRYFAFAGIFIHFLGISSDRKKWKHAGNDIVAGGFFLILVAWVITAGRLPLLNSWEVFLLVICIIPLLGLIISRGSHMEVVGTVSLLLTLIGAVGIVFLPAEGSIIKPPVAILKSRWREIHILSTMLSYALLFLTAGLSVRILLQPSDSKTSRTTYRLLLLGEVLLGIGISTGAAWAYDAWGRYWGWDPKEVWALVAWILFAASLHGRAFRLFSARGWALMNLLAFAALLFTFFGVTYLLSGLHSYG